MGDVFQISQEYLEESLGERTMIGADKFPLKSYSVLILLLLLKMSQVKILFSSVRLVLTRLIMNG